MIKCFIVAYYFSFWVFCCSVSRQPALIAVSRDNSRLVLISVVEGDALIIESMRRRYCGLGHAGFRPDLPVPLEVFYFIALKIFIIGRDERRLLVRQPRITQLQLSYSAS